MWVGSVTSPCMGLIRGQYVFLMSASRNLYVFYQSSYELLILLFSWKEYAYELCRTLTQTRTGIRSVTVPSIGPMRGQYVFLILNLQMCIHFLYSVSIYNDSAFYFTEIIVLISWEGIPIQTRMQVGSITFHAWGGGGGMMGQYVFFMSKSWNIYMYTLFNYYLQRPSLLFPWNEYSYYFGRYPDSNKNGAGLHHISWYRAKEGSICLPYVKIQNVIIHFQLLIIVLGFYFLEMVMPIR